MEQGNLLGKILLMMKTEKSFLKICVPDLPKLSNSGTETLKKQISTKFNSHYGELENVWFPLTREDSLNGLIIFYESLA